MLNEYITNFSELKEHVQNKEKHRRYDTLLDRLGCDIDFFKEKRENQKIIMAEQLGSWFYITYKQRKEIIDNLKNTKIFKKSESKVEVLLNDRYTNSGQKSVFQKIALFDIKNAVNLTSKQFNEKYKGYAYSYLNIDEIKERIHLIFDTILDIVNLPLSNINIFNKSIRKMLSQQNKNIIKPSMILGNVDFDELFHVLKHTDIKRINLDIDVFKNLLNENDTWNDFWLNVNEYILNTKIGFIDNLFNQFILAIKDPHKTATTLKKLLKQDDNKVSFLGIIDEEDKRYYTVYYDISEKKFFYNKNNESIYLSWDKIRDLAKQNKTGGPTVILEYLMMAAAGIYLLLDYKDAIEKTNVDVQIQQIHQKEIYIKSPIVTFDICENRDCILPKDYSFLSLYSHYYKKKIDLILNKFLHGK